MAHEELRRKWRSKRFAALLLILVGVIGSLITFFTTNLLMSDLSNMFYGTHDAYIIASFPGFTWTLYSILGELFIFRFYYRPQYRRSLVRTYSIIGCCFALFGIVTSILTGAIIYNDFLAPWPFPGYTIGNLIIHILIFAGLLFMVFYVNKLLPADEKRRPISIQYVGYTIFMVILTWFALDRFGGFLFSPLYIEPSTLYLTFPFYVTLVMPLLELVHTIMYMFDYFKERPKIGLIYSFVILGLDLIFLPLVIILGYNFPQFISAVSPAMALERLASLPVDIILTTVIMVGLTAYNMRYSIFRYLKWKKQQAEAK